MLSQGLEDRQAALRGQISRLDDSSDPKVMEVASSAAGFCVPLAMADGPLLIGDGACAVGMGIVVVSGIIGGLVAEDAVQILENPWYDYDRTSRQLEEVEKRLDGLVWGEKWQYYPAPQSIPGIPGLEKVKPKTSYPGGLRRRWKDTKGNIYEWDYRHGKVEKYDKRGRHKGEFDPDSGKQTKGPDDTRTVKP